MPCVLSRAVQYLQLVCQGTCIPAMFVSVCKVVIDNILTLLLSDGTAACVCVAQQTTGSQGV